MRVFVLDKLSDVPFTNYCYTELKECAAFEHKRL
jgi:hypothetical protein